MRNSKLVTKVLAASLAITAMLLAFMPNAVSKVEADSSTIQTESTKRSLVGSDEENKARGIYLTTKYDINGDFMMNEVRTAVSDRLIRIEYYARGFQERDPEVYSGANAKMNYYQMISNDVGNKINVDFIDEGKRYVGALYQNKFMYRENGKDYFIYSAWLETKD